MRILAFDISASPGIALLEIKDRRAGLIAVDHVDTTASLTDAQRFAVVESFVNTFIFEHTGGKVDAIVREKFIRGGSKRSTQLVFGAWASVDNALATFGYSIPDENEIVASTVKRLVAGNGRAQKDEVAEGVIRRLGEGSRDLFYTQRGRLLDDRADAVAIGLAWAMQKGLIDE